VKGKQATTIQTHRQAVRQTGKLAENKGRQTNRQEEAGKHTGRKNDRGTGRQTASQSGRHTYTAGQARRQADIQAGTHT